MYVKVLILTFFFYSSFVSFFFLFFFQNQISHKNYYVRVSAHNAQGESAMCNKNGLLCNGVVAVAKPDGVP